MRKHAWARGFAWMAAGLVMWCAAVGALLSRDAQWNTGRVSVRRPSANITQSSLSALRSTIEEDTTNTGKATAWGQTLADTVSVSATGAGSSVDTLWVDGDASLVWALPLVTGNLPSSSDTEGCALDLRTALTLFGSADIVGRTVTLGGGEMIVRGVFQLPEGLSSLGVNPGRGIAVRSGAGSANMTELEFLVQGDSGADPTAVAKGWMQSAGMPAGGSWNDHSDGGALLGMLIGLPALMLGVFILMEVWRSARRLCQYGTSGWRSLRSNRTAPDSALRAHAAWWFGGMAAIAALCAAVVLAIPMTGGLPPAYLPTVWSDFAFWPNLLTAKAQAAAQAALTAALRPDRAYDALGAWCAGMSLAAMASLLHGRNALARAADVGVPPGMAVGWGGLMCAAALPLGAWTAARAGWTAAAPTMALPLIAGWWAAFAGVREARLAERYMGMAARHVEVIISRARDIPMPVDERLANHAVAITVIKDELKSIEDQMRTESKHEKERKNNEKDRFHKGIGADSGMPGVLALHTARAGIRGDGGIKRAAVLGEIDRRTGGVSGDYQYVRRSGRIVVRSGEERIRRMVAADMARRQSGTGCSPSDI